ncbi:class I glutamine amidotransferase-like protein, partial [Trichodelitschia bisporula]
MSAIADSRDQNEPIQVLFALHDGFDTLDFTGPLEILSQSQHDFKDSSTKAFEITTCAVGNTVKSGQGLSVQADVSFELAHESLSDYDILIVPGGGVSNILKEAGSKADDLPTVKLVDAFTDLQETDPSKERTLMSVCTGSLFLAQAGVLQGLAATTHPDFYTRLEILCAESARRDMGERTDVMEERYVVNNARYDLGDNPEENPFIFTKKPEGQGRRKSIARKGSDAWKASRRRESIVKRANMPLGGMRLITSGGVTAGMDAALYLVAALVSHESALEVARILQFEWKKGVTVQGIDV